MTAINNYLKGYINSIEGTELEGLIKPLSSNDKIIGRQKEIDDLISELSTKEGIPVLIGDSGIGKVSILAASQTLHDDIDVLELKTVPLISKSDEIEKVFEVLEDTLSKYQLKNKERRVILFVDDFHIFSKQLSETMLSDGSKLGYTISSLRRHFGIVGATSEEEYKMYIQHDDILKRVTKEMYIDELPSETVFDILREKSKDLGIDNKISDVMLWSIINHNKQLSYFKEPAKSIDILITLKGKNEVTQQVIDDKLIEKVFLDLYGLQVS